MVEHQLTPSLMTWKIPLLFKVRKKLSLKYEGRIVFEVDAIKPSLVLIIIVVCATDVNYRTIIIINSGIFVFEVCAEYVES